MFDIVLRIARTKPASSLCLAMICVQSSLPTAEEATKNIRAFFKRNE